MTAIININLELTAQDFTERPEIIQAIQTFAGISAGPRITTVTPPKQELEPETKHEPVQQDQLAEEHDQTENPDPVSDNTVSAAELRALVAAKTKANPANRAKVKELLDDYNAPSVSAVAKKDYADFYADLELLEG